MVHTTPCYHYYLISYLFEFFCVTVEVQGAANMAAMHQNIKRVVDQEQEKCLWL